MLWVSADPGCGKSALVEHLLDEDDFGDQKNFPSALCCLLRQLFLQKPHLLSEAVTNGILAGGSKIINSRSELWRILTKTAKAPDAGEVICLLDALDEYLYSEKGTGKLKFLERA
ncbi:hypothetical protein VUR80DRAFT_7775 [Thermomyces stellatus]